MGASLMLPPVISNDRTVRHSLFDAYVYPMLDAALGDAMLCPVECPQSFLGPLKSSCECFNDLVCASVGSFCLFSSTVKA